MNPLDLFEDLLCKVNTFWRSTILIGILFLIIAVIHFGFTHATPSPQGNLALATFIEITLAIIIILIGMIPFLKYTNCNAKKYTNCNAKNITVTTAPKQQVEDERFSVETTGKFNAGYKNQLHEILIITDTQTGQQYLGIIGVGITKLHRENKATKEVKLPTP